jgi:hypothetical protein
LSPTPCNVHRCRAFFIDTERTHEDEMKFIGTGLTALAIGLLPAMAQAAPLAHDTSVLQARPGGEQIEQVQYRGWRGHRGHRYGYGYRHRGYGVGAGVAGLAAGAIIGGAIANSQASQSNYYEGRSSSDGALQYCIQRFKSFDPQSGTYLGYDGNRHACP